MGWEVYNVLLAKCIHAIVLQYGSNGSCRASILVIHSAIGPIVS